MAFIFFFNTRKDFINNNIQQNCRQESPSRTTKIGWGLVAKGTWPA